MHYFLFEIFLIAIKCFSQEFSDIDQFDFCLRLYANDVFHKHMSESKIMEIVVGTYDEVLLGLRVVEVGGVRKNHYKFEVFLISIFELRPKMGIIRKRGNACGRTPYRQTNVDTS